MKTFIEQVYKVEECFDRSSHLVARFTTESVANAFKQQSTNNCYLSVYKENLNIVVFETLEEALTHNVQQAKAAALAKLTSTERALLGL